ncbi:MAG TPA: ATPase [Eggerthellaceae bacterium]|nr:ATPase [Eggerthellaceae bacterium]
MFVGRENEIRALDRLFEKAGFQMVVVYGRRRVGKTSLIDEFTRGKPTLYFTAKAQSSILNLRDFSVRAYSFFGMPASLPPFSSWADALGFVAEQSEGERIVVVFDEFPYAAQSDPPLPSVLQEAIDHGFKQGNVFMVLCGSNQGFIESEVLGKKSPPYGRRTGQIHLGPFDYLDAARMISDTAPEQALRYYATLGGTPYYLEQVDAGASYEENVAAILFDKVGLLYEEPAMLLRQELREPATYNSILAAVAHGATEPARISDWSGVSPNSVGKYLKTLSGLGLIERSVPFGSNPDKSRSGMYSIADPFFAFWYRFVGPAVDAIELGAGAAVASQTCAGQALPTYEGTQFKKVCLQWLARKNAQGLLPFLATSFGKWWGASPEERATVDVDVIAASKQDRALLCGECKWRNDFDETEAISLLERRSRLVPGRWDNRTFALFSKHAAGAGTLSKAKARGDLMLLSAEDLFAG